MNKLDKKSLIIVISSVLLIIAVSAVSFAFLGSFQRTLNNANVNIVAQNVNNTYFNVTNNVSFSLDVDPTKMNETNNGNYVAENTAILDVSINPAADGLSVKCTYDIIFEYDSSSNIYGVSPTPVTTGASKELTLQAIGPNGTSDYFEEKNFNLTSRKKTIVSGAEIVNSIADMPTTHRWKFVNRFYNLNLDQSALANKSFKGRYYVANVSCDRYEDNTIYSLIKNRYKNNDTYVKLYSESDASTYANPVYYFNGAVEDNNVLFAGFCWKIVRTTETGGVKMVYNGTLIDTPSSVTPLEESQYVNVTNDATYPYTFDSTNKTWTSTNHDNDKTGTITFTVSEPGDYYLNYTVSSETCCDKAEFLKGTNSLGKFANSGTIALTGLTTSDVITVKYSKDGSASSGSDNVIFSLGKAIGEVKKSCNNSGTATQLASTKAFNSSSSPAYVGYMYNTVYKYSSKSMSSQSNIVFGNSFNYNSNNGTYTLTGTKTIVTWSSGYNTINSNHYTCFTTGTTCTSLYYVYYTNSSTAYYITLSNGKSVDDALNEMLYADDVNKKDSTIKTYIDSWYKDNMTSYTDKLEDTIFCNDRTMYNQSANGWNPNGGSTTETLRFKNYNTNYSLACTNETDRFSVSNNKAKLTYPVGLLSAPEVWLAYRNANYSSYYLNTGNMYWLASPISFNNNNASGRYVATAGNISGSNVSIISMEGVRPAVSLKPGTGYTGDGSYTNPFVVE